MSGYSGGGGGEGDQTINSLPARDNYGNSSGQPLPPSFEEVIPNERDLIILQECRSFVRAFAFGTIAAVATSYAFPRHGKLAPHLKDGSLIKVWHGQCRLHFRLDVLHGNVLGENQAFHDTSDHAASGRSRSAYDPVLRRTQKEKSAERKHGSRKDASAAGGLSRG